MCNYNVPILRATPDYSNHIKTCCDILFGIRNNLNRTMQTVQRQSALPPRIPMIHTIELHEGFDVLKTGRFMGTDVLLPDHDNEVTNVLLQRLETGEPTPLPAVQSGTESLPRMIELFSDDDIDYLLENLRCRIEEVMAIRSFEQELSRSDSDYRKTMICER